MNKDLNDKIVQVLDGSHQDDMDIHEISIGKISSTFLLSRLMGQLKKIDDKPLMEVLKTISYMIYTTSLQHNSPDKNKKR
jgi:hypothetical protein